MLHYDESKPFLFVSYAHKDTEKVVPIIERLQKEGYNVWYDDGIDPGTEWDENIAKHVINCSYFVAFISKSYIDSDNCKDELNYSRDLKKEQLLVYLEDVVLPDGMAMRLNRLQAIWWNKYDDKEEPYLRLFSAKGIDKTFINEKNNKVENNSLDSSVINNQTAAHTKSINNAGNVKSSNIKSEKKKSKKPFIIGGIIVGTGILSLIATLFIMIFTDGLSALSGDRIKDSNLKGALECYHTVDSNKYNEIKALEYLDRSIKDGNNDAEFIKAFILSFGQIQKVDADYSYSFDYFNKEKDNNPYAMLALGHLIYNGYGCEANQNDGMQMCMDAMDQIDSNSLLEEKNLVYKPEACFLVAHYFTMENKDYELYSTFLKEAAKDELQAAYSDLGCYYISGSAIEMDYDKGLEYLKKGADCNYYISLYNIGIMYNNGYGVKQNIKSAFYYFEKSMNAGYINAYHTVGNCYIYGTGVNQDIEYGLEVLNDGAKKNDTECYNCLGDYYLNGIDGEPDYKNAFKYYQKGFDAGNKRSAECLAYCYEYGYGTRQDNKISEYYENYYE